MKKIVDNNEVINVTDEVFDLLVAAINYPETIQEEIDKELIDELKSVGNHHQE
jgi:hypothetical protein